MNELHALHYSEHRERQDYFVVKKLQRKPGVSPDFTTY